MAITATWTPLDAAAQIATADDITTLDALLDHIHAATPDSEPQAVTITIADTPTPRLVLILGGDTSSVSWYGTTGEHTSRGTGTGREPWLPVVFAGEWSDLEYHTLIPTTHARQAAREFITTGGNRPTNLTWDTDLAQT